MKNPVKKPVVITSLAMRFYAHHGWTDALLRAYLVHGNLMEWDKDVKDLHYFVMQPHSKLDVEKMIADGHIGELLCKNQWGELKGKTDLEILQDRNW